MTADSPNAPENRSSDEELDSDWVDGGQAGDQTIKPMPISGSASGQVPDLRGEVKKPVAPRLGEASGMVRSDVTQDVSNRSGRRELEVQEAKEVFKDLEEVDAHKVLADGRQAAEEKRAFRKTDELDEEDADRAKPVAAPAPVDKPMPMPSMKSIVAGVLGRSIFEKLSWLALLVLLAGFVGVLFFPALRDLKSKSFTKSEVSFPVQGQDVTILSAATYWRKPIVDGPEADIIRRGTILLPVLEMHVDGGPAAVRLLFRNNEGIVVGDSVTRAIEESRVIKLSATAGFGDMAMYAKYRTIEGEPWTVEVYEAGSVNDEVEEFKKLLEIEIEPVLKE